MIPLSGESDWIFVDDKVWWKQVSFFVSVQLLIRVQAADFAAVEEEQPFQGLHLVQPRAVDQVAELSVQGFQQLGLFVEVVQWDRA